jgi:serine/threonine-protein kinase ATR
MKVLRENKDTLMAILDAFVHDPLLEWEEQATKQVRPIRDNRDCSQYL